MICSLPTFYEGYAIRFGKGRSYFKIHHSRHFLLNSQIAFLITLLLDTFLRSAISVNSCSMEFGTKALTTLVLTSFDSFMAMFQGLFTKYKDFCIKQKK